MNRTASLVTRSSLLVLVLIAGLALSRAGAVSADAAAPQPPAGATAAAALAATPDLLPIRTITLYRSGVGYFERSGLVSADTEVSLRFHTDQINDILKSMVVLLDPAKGRLDAISYGSKEPLERRLASFGVNIADNPSIPDLLDRLRGAPIKVLAAGDQVTGTILGVEQRAVAPVKDRPAFMAPHLNLVTPTGMRSIAITDISSFDILDKSLADELTKALAALAEYRADRSKTVNLRFSGPSAAALPVTVAYIHEMPVWKTSYRLILPDTDAAGKPKDANSSLTIQGWAIVENTTDNDWNDVRLSLVSGRPVSFQMDLYEPLFVYRPQIPVPTVPGVAPRAYQAGMEEFGHIAMLQDLGVTGADSSSPGALSKQGAYEPRAMDEAGRRGVPSGGGGGRSPFRDDQRKYGDIPQIDMHALLANAAGPQAQGAEVGEVFQYQLEAPVTIERQRSAMIPILAAPIAGRRVSIFNPADGGEHPMRGVELTNNTNLQLLPGPLAVFDGPAYAGDAQIGHISTGDKRLLAYSVDLDVHTLTKLDSQNAVTRLKIVDGLFEQTAKSTTTSTYAFDNKDAKRPRTIVIEQAKQEGWKLVEPAKPAEETQTLYRFEVAVPAAKAATLAVKQERVEHQRVAVSSIDMPTILAYAHDGKVSPAVVKAVTDVASRQAAINDSERTIQDLDRQTGEIGKDQSRIRENMTRIDHSSQLYTRYMTKLTEQETQLEDLAQRRAKAQQQHDSLVNDLNAFLKTLNVE